MTPRVVEKLCTKKVCVDLLAPRLLCSRDRMDGCLYATKGGSLGVEIWEADERSKNFNV